MYIYIDLAENLFLHESMIYSQKHKQIPYRVIQVL